MNTNKINTVLEEQDITPSEDNNSNMTKPSFTREDVDAFYEENREMVDFITNDVIENHPDILQYRETIQKNNDHDCIAAAMEEFLAEFPDNDEKIRNVDDFSRVLDPHKFKMLIENGLSFNDAYKLVNYERLVNSKNGGNSNSADIKKALKGHIKTSGSFDRSNETPVPSDVVELYKSLCKGWSDEKIKRHFLSSQK